MFISKRMDDDPRQRLPMKCGKLCIPVPMKIHRLEANLCFFFFYNRRWWRSCWKFHLLPKQYRRLSNFPIPFIMDRSRLRRIGNSLARLNMGNLISSKLPRVPSEFKAHGAAWFTRIASSRLTLSFRYTVRYEGNVVSKLRCLCAFSVCLPEIYTRRCMLQRRGNAFKSLSAIAHTHTRTHTHTHTRFSRHGSCE